MNTPFVSVIISAYNVGDCIARSVGSVLFQDFENLEVIVVDDGSEDSTAEIVKGMDDPRVRYVSHDANRQLMETRRTGIESARGEYVMFLDAGDELEQGVISYCHRVASKGNYDIVQFPIRVENGGPCTPEAIETAQGFFVIETTELAGREVVSSMFSQEHTRWNLCGKMISKNLAMTAYAAIPPQRLFYGEDCYAMFLIGCLAEMYYGDGSAPAYRYSFGTGESGLTHIDFARFKMICIDGKAVSDGIESFLNENGLMNVFETDYKFVRDRFLAISMQQLFSEVEPAMRPEALDVIISTWSYGPVLKWLCTHIFAETSLLPSLFDAAESLEFGSVDHIFGVAIFCPQACSSQTLQEIRGVFDALQSSGFTVTLIAHEELELPEGHFGEAKTVRISKPCPDNVKQWVEDAESVIKRCDIDAVVFCNWLEESLAWDVVAARLSGVYTIVRPTESFSGLFKSPYADRLLAGYESAHLVASSSETDIAFWSALNRCVCIPSGSDSDCNARLWGEVMKQQEQTVTNIQTTKETWESAIKAHVEYAHEAEERRKRLDELTDSTMLKVGKVVTAVPRKLKKTADAILRSRE